VVDRLRDLFIGEVPDSRLGHRARIAA
jgi:hypothetical protein